jgi:hypothetical protein
MSVALTIAGVDRTSSVSFNSLKKTDNLNQQVDTLTFQIRKYGALSYVPALGEEVMLDKDDATIFGGIIVRITENVTASKILSYTILCNDYSQFLKRELVTARYESTTVGDIIADLIDNYTDDDQTYTNVSGTLAIESISFSRLSVADCIQKLADAISYIWYVDYDRDLHFFPKNTEMGPALSDESDNYIYDSLEIVEDLTQIRNSVLVQGGDAEAATPRTEYFDGDGTRAQFALANKFASLPTVTVDGTPQTVGVEFLDDDASFDCMWNFNEKYLRFTSGNTPAGGSNNVTVSGTYLYPIAVRVPAPASIAVYGTYEFAITDDNISSHDEAIARAIAELQSYQNAIYEGSFRSYADGFRSGQVVSITSAQRSRSISVLIQSVTAKMRDPEGSQFEYSISFATLKSIGIIDYLQAQLRSKEIIVDDQETLLSDLPVGSDTATASDSLGTPSATTGPYPWSDDAGSTSNKLVWGFGTWS